MNSLKNDETLDDSLIILDASNNIENVAAEEEEEEGLIEDSTSEMMVTLDKTLPPGVAPEGFVIVDETIESESASVATSKEICDDNDATSDGEITTKPLFKIIFRDGEVSRNFKKRVQEFFQRLVSKDSKIEDSTTDKLVLEVWSKKPGGRKRGRSCPKNKKNSDCDKKEYQNDNALFTIEKKPALQTGLDVPTYGKKFERVMDSTSETTKADEKDEKMICRRQMNCFNCMGNHGIRDCPEPRDYSKIVMNRNNFTSRSVQKVSRYHADNDDRKSERFAPGRISRDLKRALGIDDNQLPQHIYRMRILGYPPGWLKEAKLEHSGMNLYNSDGDLEQNPSEEPEQIVEFGDKDQYDAKKIQDFPGFNIRPPSGTKEDDKHYWKSHRYASNSKESLLATISDRKVDDGYKRKKFKRNLEPEIVDHKRNLCEMDLDQNEDDNVVENVSVNGFFIPPLPKDSPKLVQEPEDRVIDSLMADTNSESEAAPSPIQVDSPSLADLERRKRQLLVELDDTSESLASGVPVTPLRTGSRASTDDNQQNDTTLEHNDEASETAIYNSNTPSRGSIKSIDLGTPILESTSPYRRLPAVENFAKDVCDIMHFENLPDSTGKYEQMTGILQKVRTTLATHQQE